MNEYSGNGLGSMWRNDTVELHVDGDHSGGLFWGYGDDAYTEEEIKRLNDSSAQTCMAIAEAPDDRRLRCGNAGDAWVSQPPWAAAGGLAFGNDPSYSVIEVALTPWDDLDWQGPEHSRRSDLQPGKIIGFQIGMADVDGSPGQYHGYHTIEAGSRVYADADNFVDGLLIGAGGEGSAVRADTWARIKAGLR